MRQYFCLVILTLGACGGGGGGSSAPATPPAPTPTTYSISEVQGDGPTSPLEGQNVSVTGLVTGDFQDNDADTASSLGGFFVQGSPPDFDFATSDGVFVFDGNNPAVDVDVGDLVTVEGVVNEYFGETQISASSVRIVGAGSLVPAFINLPTATTVNTSDGAPIADLERYEGMLVRFPQTLTVTATYELERYGSVQLSQGGRLYQFTNGNAPDAASYATYRDDAGARSIHLDDGQRAENVWPVRLLSASAIPGYTLRAGDTITELVGVLRYSRGSGGSGTEGWRLMPTVDPLFVEDNARPGAPAVNGSLKVAGINVLNFFTTIDTGQDICGPAGNEGCRGADSQQEYDRQLAKTVTTLEQIDADIVGLTELENNASASLQALVDGLNASIGAGTYAFVDTGTIGDDVIKTGFIYKPASVALAGSFEILDDFVDPDFRDDYNRPALAQTFDRVADGARLTIVVNHFKSKGSNCDAVGDPDLDDGQGNCPATRLAAATSLANWLATDPTGSNDTDVLVIGDLNAYLEEDPITALESAGFTNLVEAAGGATAYTYTWDGQAGVYDYALASTSLAPQVTATLDWHINSDEPSLHDYNLSQGRDPAIFDPDSPYRSSDHDPVIVGLDLTP